MIPLRDVNPTRRFPIITILLIAVNVVIFLYELMVAASSSDALDQLFAQAGMIPYNVTHQFGLVPLATIVTAMFLHGGWLHIGGNMLYLWIFGNNIEDALGRFRYILFYFLSGFAAAFLQIAAMPNSTDPNIGASGAIAGVLGAYLVLYPRARVQVLWFFVFIGISSVPAVIVLGFWFVLQLINGVASLGSVNAGGVAFFAHIGGFIFGAATVRLFLAGRTNRAPWLDQPPY